MEKFAKTESKTVRNRQKVTHLKPEVHRPDCAVHGEGVAAARVTRFEQRDLESVPVREVRGGQTGDAAAHHGDMLLRCAGGERGGRGCGGGIGGGGGCLFGAGEHSGMCGYPIFLKSRGWVDVLTTRFSAPNELRSRRGRGVIRARCGVRQRCVASCVGANGSVP